MSAKTTALCPCQSSLSYEDCCGRFHSGNMFPETAEQLMRSRYSAFVLKKIPYIVQTTVPSQQTLLDEKALQDWADETQWLGLDIVKAETLTKTQSAVEFKAHFQGNEQPQVHHEYSLFVKLMVVGILLIPLYRSQAINSLVFVAQGRNLNIVAEACSNDLNVFFRIILAAFSRK